MPPALDARIDALADRPARAERGLRWWMFAPAVAAVAVALVIVAVVKPGGDGIPEGAPPWYASSELEGGSDSAPPTQLLSDAATQTPGGAPVIETAGRLLRVRTGPGPEYPVKRTLPDGARVRIICTTTGPLVTGPFGTTDVWDGLDDGGRVSDAFVYTGTSAPVAPACP